MLNKSFLKWAGGKSKSVPFIQDAIPKKIKRFVEPFAGSAVVSLNVDADEYLICDYNKDLIDLFKNLVNFKADFIERCKVLFVNGNNAVIFYYNRERFNSLPSCVEKSALFVYLNRHAFNGLCRYNKSGKFNVPFGKYSTVYFPEHEMNLFINRSDRFKFKHSSFEDTFKEQRQGDVFYCDPPYIPLNVTSSFTDYVGDGFDMSKQILLVDLAEKSSIPVFISNHWIPGITDSLYKNADKLFKEVGRSISANGDSRSKVLEVLSIYNKDGRN
jgi:DNA adenine methylase